MKSIDNKDCIETEPQEVKDGYIIYGYYENDVYLVPTKEEYDKIIEEIKQGEDFWSKDK